MSLVISNTTFRDERPYWWNGSYLCCGNERYMLSKDGSTAHCGSSVIATENQSTRDLKITISPNGKSISFSVKPTEEKFTGYYNLKVDLTIGNARSISYQTYSKNVFSAVFNEYKGQSWTDENLYNSSVSGDSAINFNSNNNWADFPDHNWWGSEDITHYYIVGNEGSWYLGGKDDVWSYNPYIQVTYKDTKQVYFSVKATNGGDNPNIESAKLGIDLNTGISYDSYPDNKTIKV